MKQRIDKECLINPTEEERLDREPLLAFSFYLSNRNNVLLSISDEIIENLDKGFLDTSNKTDLIGHASTLMWLWTLGAYEVVRTMSQANVCFSESFNKKLSKLKKELAKARMPSAKMEKQGKKIPVNSNRSPDGWDIEKKDLLIGDPEEPISGRLMLESYDEIMSSLTIKDVIKHHQESYEENK
jgi:hypothetical protein